MSQETKNETINGHEGVSQWKQEHDKLVGMVGDFEKRLSETGTKLSSLENALRERTQERDNLKTKVSELETQLAEAKRTNQRPASESQAIEEMKKKSEEMLTRAKAVIFEKTKVCKNQELQIEALHQQTESLKDVVRITKDLLEIRNVEVKHLEDKLNGMDAKIAAESERHKLIHGKLEKMVAMNSELKREYETQLCLFNALRERYNERELAKNVVEDLRSQLTAERANLQNAEARANQENAEKTNNNNNNNNVEGGEGNSSTNQ